MIDEKKEGKEKMDKRKRDVTWEKEEGQRDE